MATKAGVPARALWKCATREETSAVRPTNGVVERIVPCLAPCPVTMLLMPCPVPRGRGITLFARSPWTFLPSFERGIAG